MALSYLKIYVFFSLNKAKKQQNMMIEEAMKLEWIANDVKCLCVLVLLA